ncbi:DUF4932 domain-containing protein [Tenacibaculum maritimum]|uniref:DUF4932 domain-containing protein n=1 Tax=Tenacibaculum maritimum TaxID=107401 RepID=UPI0012E68D85|nr:DUF4932 domain-containing protein [Tenacibaculum maritimum]CAA0182930.1 Probable lipoprotein precursor [Tenacibaculum maritimum]
MKIKQSLKITIYIFCLVLFIFSCQKSKKESKESKEIISVKYPETYELANIILALTEYGKTDKWEVRQGFDYYNKVQEYFKPVNQHPLLDSVNYSRERWEEYLSFRTDSYAFEFDENNELKRRFEFYANKGFQPFDDHLDLINNFVQKSNFRVFFKQNKDYYNAVSHKYKKTQYLNEMREFLAKEFGKQYSSDEKYNVVLSPFVYRMNCHRNIDSTTVADFITIPNYVLSDTISTNEKDIATSIHNLFTEMDHGYVNPTTNQYKESVAKNFDANLWDNESGYNENNGFGVFNEYMTWAVYDIFLEKHFPDYANEVGLNWSFQNDSRGLEYSQLFTKQLLALYNQKEDSETLKDLYPKILEWTSEIQKDLSKPKIISPKDSTYIKFSGKTKIAIMFSEPMKKSDTITTIFQDGKNLRQCIDLNGNENNLRWSENGKELEFEFSFPTDRDTYYFQFNWWGTKHPLISEKGVLIKSGSYFKIIDK